MDILTPDPTSVYRYYDKSGVLLYVGITSRGTRRQREHNADKEWWPFVTNQSVEHFATRREAAEREKQLIREFRPPFNKQHNTDWRDLREFYMAAAETMPAVEREVSHEAVLAPSRAFHAVGGKVPLTQIQPGLVSIFVASRAFRDLFRSTKPVATPILLRAPRKLGTLGELAIYKESPELTFGCRGGGIPRLHNVHAHLKVVSASPFVVRLHEVVGERAA